MKKLVSAFACLILLLSLMLQMALPSVLSQATDLNVLVRDTISEPIYIDPAWVYDAASAELLMNVYEPLLWFNRAETGEFLPMLATEWNWVEGGGKLKNGTIMTRSPENYTWVGRWEFKIRTTATFQDAGGGHSWEGATLTTADVEYTFERLLVTDNYDGPAKMVWKPVLNAYSASDVDAYLTAEGFPLNETTGWNTRVDEAIDHTIECNDTHVWFNLVMPYPQFLGIIAQQLGSILCKDWCTDTSIPGHDRNWPGMQVGDSWANYWNPDEPALGWLNGVYGALGTGPYMFNYWNTGPGGLWSVVKNPNYWRGWTDYDGLHPAHVNEYQSWYIPEWSMRQLRLLGGISDFCAVPRMYMNEILGKPGIDCMWPLIELSCNAVCYNLLVSNTSTHLGRLLPNDTWAPDGAPANIFNYSAVRLGFAHAFNYTKYLEALTPNEAISPTTPILDILTPNVAQPGQPEDPAHGLKKKYGISTEPADTLAYNLTLAAEYLKKIPGLWANGFTMDFVYNDGNVEDEMVARVLKDGLDQITATIPGAPTFSITIVSEPWGQYRLEWVARTLPYFTYELNANYPDYLDAHYFAYTFMGSHGVAGAQGYLSITEFPSQEIDDEIAAGHYEWLNHKYVDLCPGFVLQVPFTHHFQRDWVDTGAIGPAPGTYDPTNAPLWNKTQEGKWVYNPIYPGEYVYDIYKSLLEVKYDVAVTAFTKEPCVDGFVAMVNRSEIIQMYKPMPVHVTVERLDLEPFFVDVNVAVIKTDEAGFETLCDDPRMAVLGPGDTVTLDFLWNQTLPIGKVYTLKAVAFVVDSNPNNNVMPDPPFQVVWWPDCNGPVGGVWAQWPSVGDDIIDAKDLRALMRSWPPEAYQEVCDFDANTVIDGKDLMVLMKYLGTAYP